MQTDQDKLVHYIRTQAKAFLAEMEDFYPFGAAVTTDGELKPLAAYLDEEELSVQALLAILEAHIEKELTCERFRIGAIAIAITIKEASQAFDAVQIRYYEKDAEVSTVNYKYLMTNGNTSWL